MRPEDGDLQAALARRQSGARIAEVAVATAEPDDAVIVLNKITAAKPEARFGRLRLDDHVGSGLIDQLC